MMCEEWLRDDIIRILHSKSAKLGIQAVCDLHDMSRREVADYMKAQNIPLPFQWEQTLRPLNERKAHSVAYAARLVLDEGKTPKEAAAIMGMNPHTIQKWVAEAISLRQTSAAQSEAICG